jgi:hypothetical protein
MQIKTDVTNVLSVFVGALVARWGWELGGLLWAKLFH